MKSAVARMTKATTDLRSEIDRIRGEIRKLNRERENVLAAPLPLKEAEERLGAWIDQQTDLAALPFRLAAFTEPEPAKERPLHVDETGGRGGGVDLAPVLAALFGDTIKERLAAALKTMPDYEPGLPLAERPKKAAELDNQILELERQEEAIITQAETNGIRIARRPDADPRAVLGVEDDEAA